MYRLRKKLMNPKPDWLHEHEIKLSNGDVALWSYDDEGDVLEIFFRDAPASATVELADGVFLRFDRQHEQPLSIGFVAATALMRSQEFGQPLLALTGLAKLPTDERKLVLNMLQASPVNAVLRVYSFKPAARAQAIPVAALAQSIPLAA